MVASLAIMNIAAHHRGGTRGGALEGLGMGAV